MNKSLCQEQRLRAHCTSSLNPCLARQRWTACLRFTWRRAIASLRLKIFFGIFSRSRDIRQWLLETQNVNFQTSNDRLAAFGSTKIFSSGDESRKSTSRQNECLCDAITAKSVFIIQHRVAYSRSLQDNGNCDGKTRKMLILWKIPFYSSDGRNFLRFSFLNWNWMIDEW